MKLYRFDEHAWPFLGDMNYNIQFMNNNIQFIFGFIFDE